jgi:hypothetical protein
LQIILEVNLVVDLLDRLFCVVEDRSFFMVVVLNLYLELEFLQTLEEELEFEL